ncbi:MAG: phosphoribosylamine--glycine ligase N-terminal domain-containing protein, partial [Clostridia bacterium]
MKILVVGSGGREHAIVRKLSESKRKCSLYCAPGNGGISTIARCIDIKATDLPGMKDFAVGEGIDLVFVASDDPLALGMVDMFGECGIKAFGPDKAAAIIEGSKALTVLRPGRLQRADDDLRDVLGRQATGFRIEFLQQ